MSYKNLVAQACADKAEYFCRLRDFLCQRNGTYADYSVDGIGWTLHDSSYAVDEDNPELYDWFVITSAGENGDDAIFCQIIWGVGDLDIKGYLYWDNSAHTGTYIYGNGSNLTILDAAGSYDIYVYGDLDFFMCWETLRDTNYRRTAFFGKCINTVYDTTIATSAGAITAATPATITVDSVPASWEVGNPVIIRNLGVMERVDILSISGNDITANVTNSYTANAILQEECSLICSSSVSNMSAVAMCKHAPAGAVTNIAGASTYPGFTTAYVDPDKLKDEYILGQYTMSGTDTIIGRYPNFYHGGVVGLVEKDVVTDGVNSYRYLRHYNTYHCFMREV